MKHRPYDMTPIRYGRFDVPGFACLYLGGDIETCTKEIGYSKNYSVCAYAIEGEHEILDFTKSFHHSLFEASLLWRFAGKQSFTMTEMMKQLYASYFPFLGMHFLNQLLTIEVVGNEELSYTFPRFAVRYCAARGIDGFAYRSAKNHDWKRHSACFVFFAHDYDGTYKYSHHLDKLFVQTEAVVVTRNSFGRSNERLFNIRKSQLIEGTYLYSRYFESGQDIQVNDEICLLSDYARHEISLANLIVGSDAIA